MTEAQEDFPKYGTPALTPEQLLAKWDPVLRPNGTALCPVEQKRRLNEAILLPPQERWCISNALSTTNEHISAT